MKRVPRKQIWEPQQLWEVPFPDSLFGSRKYEKQDLGAGIGIGLGPFQCFSLGQEARLPGGQEEGRKLALSQDQIMVSPPVGV